jgi:riboflavin kinase/FMN adenylyltransferase
VANIGIRPTVKHAGGERLLEVHLFDFEEEIYGEDLEIRFRRFLRPEQRFAGLEELKAQIAADALRAREALAASGPGVRE